MNLSEKDRKYIMIYATVLGVLFMVVGFIEFITAFWNWFIVPTRSLCLLTLPCQDLFGGLAALTIGAVFLRGVMPLWRGRYEAIGFILVGSLLSATYGIVYLLIIGADGFNAYLSYLSGAEWTWEWLTQGTLETGILRPEVWLAFSSIPLGILALRVTKAKKETK